MSHSTNKANVILMAAGLGSRMRPVTDTMPKPLVSVGEMRLIDTVIRAFPKDIVNRFYVVTGYLGSRFECLLNEYDNVSLIANPDFDNANNISSVFYALDILKSGSCFICESDLYICDGSFLKDIPDTACYYGRFTHGSFDDWGFDLDDSGRITRVKKGCENTYAMVGISYFDEKAAAVLADCIDKAYKNSGMKNIFWDEAVDINLDKLSLKIKEVKENQIIEIDTVEELEKARKIYGRESCDGK